MDALKTTIVTLFLVYASWSDYKTREVSDKVWILLAPLSFAITMTQLTLYAPDQLVSYSISFAITAVFAIVLFYSGGFGGADSKALMCLALALPFYPNSLFTPLGGPLSPISKMAFPVTVFSNSVLFAAFAAVVLFGFNLLSRLKTKTRLFEGDLKQESFWKKILVLITGYRVPIEKLREKWHVYPMEDIEKKGENEFKRKIVVLPKDEGRNEIIERLDAAIKTGTIGEKVWATPGLPMLIFVTAGLLVALFFGDLVWICIRLVLG